jgi:hypothetical protein
MIVALAQFLRTVAGHFQHRIVDLQDFPIQGKYSHPNGRALERGLEAGFEFL